MEPGDLETLAAAGIELVGENRVEQLLAKQEVARDRFTWDFIGHLQSRKARDLVGPRPARALALDALGRRAPRPRGQEPVACLVEVNAGRRGVEGGTGARRRSTRSSRRSLR